MKKYILLLSVFSLLFSCDMKEKYENENSKVVELAGEWFVYWYIDGTQIYGPTTLLTYNTAADDGSEIWVDDLEEFWWFKAKVDVISLSDLTFGNPTDTLDNEYYTSEFIVQNGSVFEQASVQPSGATTDSIYFEVLFNDDAPAYGTVYQCAGVRRTGLLEDEI